MSTLLKNPIIYSDVPDVDVIRVGNAYYMVSTTMHVFPGCPVMKSTDLAHWEIVSYIFDILEEDERCTLADGIGIYGSGQWATALREHNGKFYAFFSCNNTRQFYIYETENIEKGPWSRKNIPQLLHDPGVLFDDGKVFVICNCGDIRIVELNSDLTGFKEGGIDQPLFSTPKENIGLRCEGCHAYKLNGSYYLLYIEWPTDGHARRRVVCYRSKELLGSYERKIVFDDDMGYLNKGIAQGGLFDTPDGDWYVMLFQDRDAVGRCPFILPVTWEDGWPMIGFDGKAKEFFEVPMEEYRGEPIVTDDDFDYEENKLALQWQWNHNPDNANWSVTKKKGYLRLTTGHLTNCVVSARNTLTQRTMGPKTTAYTVLETSGMKDGDYAGMVALQSNFGTVGVKKEGDKSFITMTVKDGMGGEKEEAKIAIDTDKVYFKIFFDFENSKDEAEFYYSLDGGTYEKIGITLKMLYTLDHFMGYRIGLYNYATKTTGGYADFDYLKIEY